MYTHWIKEKKLTTTLVRNEAFWQGELEEYPLMWLLVPGAKPKPSPPSEPTLEEEIWTDVDYVMRATESDLARTYYGGDALPIFCPWLGPNQFAAWLGAPMTIKPKEFTSWVDPCIENWDNLANLSIDPDNRWWKLYLEIYRSAAEAGRDKWVTGYPDLHSGIDALSALRGSDRLAMDLLINPESVLRAMKHMTNLFKFIVDEISNIILPAGQGTTNWTWGWSEKRYLCIGQNDFSCMISPEMFDQFVLHDTIETADYVDIALYHMDGPGQIPHLDRLLAIESLNTIQWIWGDGQPPGSKWLDLMKRMQAAGKNVQVLYNPYHIQNVVNIHNEVDILCRNLDPTRLFIVAYLNTAEDADELIKFTRKICAEKRNPQIAHP